MRVATVFGTRPEIIRLSRIIEVIDGYCEQTLIHTGQNYDPNLSDIFFKELGIRSPDIHLGIEASRFEEQAGRILSRTGEAFQKIQPDRLLILGDTNSALCSIAAARMGILVHHLEAGNRCYDDRVPEEINRRVIDHTSNVLMPYTQRSKENLVREGIPRERIFVTGNPIYEVLRHYAAKIDASGVLTRLKLKPKKYFLVTMHRSENVDIASRLRQLLNGLQAVRDRFSLPVIVSLHPRTADKISHLKLNLGPGIRMLKPLGFFDFVHLEQRAFCVISDSGTVQEECSIFRVPNVTIRDVTERPETLECGSNILSGASPNLILKAAEMAVGLNQKWTPPSEYLADNVSSAVAKILLGYSDLGRKRTEVKVSENAPHSTVDRRVSA